MNEARSIQRDLSGGEATITSEALLLALVRHVAEARTLHWRDTVCEPRAKLGGRHPGRSARPVAARRAAGSYADLTEQVDTRRILDACGNRAREGLRVVEDYCRFVLEDAFLSGQLKQLRHDLAAALAGLQPDTLLAARDTAGDIGTALSTASEHQRHSLRDVARTNWKRLQEALRSLEEFGKLHDAELGKAIEQLRYRSYTLEGALLLGATARERLAEATLYVLLSALQAAAASLEQTIVEAAAGSRAGDSVARKRAKRP